MSEERQTLCKRARELGIRANIYRSNETLEEQISWRLARLSIIKKWERFPTDVVSVIMFFVGNESEMKSAITDKQLEKVRKRDLRHFNQIARLWGQFNAVVIHHENMDRTPAIEIIIQTEVKAREEMKTDLVEIASRMSPPPKFPWCV
jgi:hypothetical protein